MRAPYCRGYENIWWVFGLAGNGRRANTWWRHQKETFSALLAICAGNSLVTGEFPAQRPVTRSLMFSLIYAWINGWVNNREAGDLSCHRPHYDVTVMLLSYLNCVSIHEAFNVIDINTVRNDTIPDSKVHGANMGSICGRQDPGGPHVDPMNHSI